MAVVKTASKQKRNVWYFVGLLALILGPSGGSLAYYKISNDPNFRPLAVTEQALRDFEIGRADGNLIVANVDWTTGANDGFTKAQLERAIIKAFRAKGVDVSVRFKPSREGTRITYLVGASYMGPYPTSRAADGIAAAVAAYHMYQKHGQTS